MTAFTERRTQDLAKLNDLAAKSGGKVKIRSTKGNPISEIELDLLFNTAPSKEYPRIITKTNKVTIHLSNRYPFQEPTASFKTPIFHPNVYASGKICFGTKWLPTNGLDLLVKRIIQIIIFDTTILNEKSPANNDALKWYRNAKIKYPQSFPTDTLIFCEKDEKKKIRWANINKQNNEKVLINCSNCRIKLRLPKGKCGIVKCPKCQSEIKVTT